MTYVPTITHAAAATKLFHKSSYSSVTLYRRRTHISACSQFRDCPIGSPSRHRSLGLSATLTSYNSFRAKGHGSPDRDCNHCGDRRLVPRLTLNQPPPMMNR
ncbi:hypothetical protein MRX96_008860 [Rhipicephalus microplus]